MFWRSRDAEKDPLIYGDKFEDDDEYDYRMWGDYRRSLSESVEQSVNKPEQKMINIKPFIIHSQHTMTGVSSESEYAHMKTETFSPSTRIANYFNSLSQDQCTKLINQFGKMLDEL